MENLLLCKKGVGHVIVIESFGVDLETSPGSGAGLLGLRREIVQDEADKASRLGQLVRFAEEVRQFLAAGLPCRWCACGTTCREEEVEVLGVWIWAA